MHVQASREFLNSQSMVSHLLILTCIFTGTGVQIEAFQRDEYIGDNGWVKLAYPFKYHKKS